MDESDEPNKPEDAAPTPEMDRLLKMLDVQAAARRQRRTPASNLLQTSSFRYGSLVAIVIFALGSLGLLEWILSEMPKPSHPSGRAAPVEVLKSGSGEGVQEASEALKH